MSLTCCRHVRLTEIDRKEEEKEGEDKSQPRSIRDRRRPREKRRSTGVSFWTQDVRAPLWQHLVWCSPLSSPAQTHEKFMCDPPSDIYLFSFLFQGDENDPDQQSDSEEGSTKGEPQVIQHAHIFHIHTCSLASLWPLLDSDFLFQSLVPHDVQWRLKLSPLPCMAMISSPPTKLYFHPRRTCSLSPSISWWLYGCRGDLAKHQRPRA